MKCDNNGGAAFPADVLDMQYEGNYHHLTAKRYPGMTLRDYFAAKAMEGDFASQSPETGEWSDSAPDEIILKRARFFYRFADAMIQVREEK